MIVNHHLLCADAAVRKHAFGEVIPACSHAIIEGHQPDVATQYFGFSVSTYRVEELARDVGGWPGGARRRLAKRDPVDGPWPGCATGPGILRRRRTRTGTTIGPRRGADPRDATSLSHASGRCHGLRGAMDLVEEALAG